MDDIDVFCEARRCALDFVLYCLGTFRVLDILCNKFGKGFVYDLIYKKFIIENRNEELYKFFFRYIGKIDTKRQGERPYI